MPEEVIPVCPVKLVTPDLRCRGCSDHRQAIPRFAFPIVTALPILFMCLAPIFPRFCDGISNLILISVVDPTAHQFDAVPIQEYPSPIDLPELLQELQRFRPQL